MSTDQLLPTRHPNRPAAALRLSATIGVAEPEILGLDQLVRPGDVCFDIGAGYGMYTFPLADLVGPAGRVYAFEPLPVPHRILSTLHRRTRLDQVIIRRAAVGPVAGDQELVLPYRFGLPIHGWAHLNSGQVRSGRRISFSTTRILPTPVITIDDVCREQEVERVTFLKIDVEGFEPAVLAGAKEVLTRDRPTLLLEIEDRHLDKYGHSAAEVADSLRRLGYPMLAWRDRRWTPVTEVTTQGRNYLFSSDPAGLR
ncbi:FkbM family methyltransferase [Microlunatus parietis]|uniref:FkbM family methyltransferase n=1 Tax=Microlunatus parietis TaxID=682979 RepID=A0A7Y9I6D3_9ACTN|nr:FkbM family methyltransferase [Microlunatus parietis]NYE70870.1 FkbM family methyltransferase [Microlunatus parietis]